jgi:hypothetical protein
MYGNVLMDLRKTLPDIQTPVQLPLQFPVQGEVPEGSIPLDEDIGEEEVPEIVLQEEEATPV